MTGPHLEVIAAAPEQSPILANLLELYAHDFSEFHNLEIGDDGRFGYAPLPLYWSDPNRHPFLVRVDGKLAGLVLIFFNGEMWDMAEFFVLRAFRRRGIGTQLAHQIWRRFPGPWQVRVMQTNVQAQQFWTAAIALFVGEAIRPVSTEMDGTGWAVFSFDSNRIGSPGIRS